MATNNYQSIIDEAHKEWATANQAGDEEAKKRAHQKAENARAMLGYSGGEDGTEKKPYNLQYNVENTTPADGVAGNTNKLDAENPPEWFTNFWGLNAKEQANNEAAKRAAVNGGLVDSFSQANSNYQDAFTRNQMMTAWTDYVGQKNNQDLAERQQTESEKNSEVSREGATADITGYVPLETQRRNNPMIQKDNYGNYIPTNMGTDFSLLINNLTQQLNSTQDPEARATIMKQIADAQDARTIKMQMLGMAQN